jgi:hypothetical protein
MQGRWICVTNMTQAEVLHDEHFGSTVNGTDGREAFPKFRKISPSTPES